MKELRERREAGTFVAARELSDGELEAVAYVGAVIRLETEAGLREPQGDGVSAEEPEPEETPTRHRAHRWAVSAGTYACTSMAIHPGVRLDRLAMTLLLHVHYIFAV